MRENNYRATASVEQSGDPLPLRVNRSEDRMQSLRAKSWLFGKFEIIGWIPARVATTRMLTNASILWCSEKSQSIGHHARKNSIM